MNRGAGGAGGGGGIGKMFSIGKVKPAVNPKDMKVKVTFKDVAGCDEAKVRVLDVHGLTDCWTTACLILTHHGRSYSSVVLAHRCQSSCCLPVMLCAVSTASVYVVLCSACV